MIPPDVVVNIVQTPTLTTVCVVHVPTNVAIGGSPPPGNTIAEYQEQLLKELHRTLWSHE
jgi:hypothetical protein